jgi:hypothetical protein
MIIMGFFIESPNVFFIEGRFPLMPFAPAEPGLFSFCRKK